MCSVIAPFHDSESFLGEAVLLGTVFANAQTADEYDLSRSSHEAVREQLERRKSRYQPTWSQRESSCN